jgi:hypothetical protein
MSVLYYGLGHLKGKIKIYESCRSWFVVLKMYLVATISFMELKYKKSEAAAFDLELCINVWLVHCVGGVGALYLLFVFVKMSSL